MEIYERQVIFSKNFSKENPIQSDQLTETAKEIDELLENDSEIKRGASFTLQEFLKDCAERYVYVSVPKWTDGQNNLFPLLLRYAKDMKLIQRYQTASIL